MSRILSAPLLDRKGSWVLGVGLAISLVVGCGSQGDNSDDTAPTGGRGYVPGAGGAGVGNGGGSVVYITGLGGNRATGGRGFGQGGVIGVGGQVVTTTPSTCTTGVLNCPCYTSGLCSTGLTCNASKVCVSNGLATGGAPGTGGSKATGGAGVGGVVGTGGVSAVAGGGSTSVAGSPATGGAPLITTGGATATGGAAATGGALATGGAPVDGGVAETGGAGGGTSVPTCNDQNVVNTPNGVISCSGDCKITGSLGVGGPSLSYDCDCDSTSHYVCFAGSTTTVACPAAVALEPAAGVACDAAKGDDFCKLTATTGTSHLTYSCSCGSTTNLWGCTK